MIVRTCTLGSQRTQTQAVATETDIAIVHRARRKSLIGYERLKHVRKPRITTDTIKIVQYKAEDATMTEPSERT